MEPNEITIDDYVAIVKRRKWSLILPALLVFAVAAAVALLLPPIYKSTATILIDEAGDTNRVRQGDGNDLRRAAAAVDQPAGDEFESAARDHQAVRSLRRHARQVDHRGDRGQDAQGRAAGADQRRGQGPPQRARGRGHDRLHALLRRQGGAAEGAAGGRRADLADLDENLKERTRQTRETSEFLEEEMNRLKAALDDLEGRISRFKEKNINALPETLAGERSGSEQHRARHRAAAGAAAQPEGARRVSADAVGQRVAVPRGEAEGHAAVGGAQGAAALLEEPFYGRVSGRD